MSSDIKTQRAAAIKLAALKMRYHRAWMNKKTGIREITDLLSRVERAQEEYRRLYRQK